MKISFTALISALCIFSIQIFPFTYSGGHDSLLFDGGSDVRIINPVNVSGDCKILVTYTVGTVEGTRYISEVFEICGQVDTSLKTERTTKLEKNNVLKSGEELSTGPDGYAEIEFYDGSVIRMAPNTKIKILPEFCDQRTVIEQITGKIWNKVKKIASPDSKYEVKTDRNGCGVRGTEFTFEKNGEKEIIKVYEGKVEVYPPRDAGEVEDAGKQMEKLAKDYQEGKVTLEEFTKKASELQQQMISGANDLNKSVMVDAGYMTTVENKITEPTAIPSDDDKWFEDRNFKK